MSNLRLVDKVERVIMEVGSVFSLKNTLLFTNRNKEDYKLDPVTVKSYEAKKPKQDNNLTTITFRSSDYLVFDYMNWETKDKNSIFVSYPNIYYVKQFFNQCMEFLETPDLYLKDDINGEYKEVFLQSEPLAGGKKLGAYPVKIERNEYLVDGMALVIGSNECTVDIDLGTFAAIADIIATFDLFTASNQLYTMALTLQGGGNTTPSSSGSFNTSSTPRRSAPGGGLGGSKNSGGGILKDRRSANVQLNGRGSVNRTPKNENVEHEEEAPNGVGAGMFDVNNLLANANNLEDEDVEF